MSGRDLTQAGELRVEHEHGVPDVVDPPAHVFRTLAPAHRPARFLLPHE